MQARDAWEDSDTLFDFLARQLNQHRLGLVLGAGASMGFGLPKWDKLVARAFELSGATRDPRQSNEDAADSLLTHLGRDEAKLVAVVRQALYENYDATFERLTKVPLLAAVGALTMASSRGSVAAVVSFNYDDLLEEYLSFFGFAIQPVHAVPAWNSSADVTVYHPHGFLPHNAARTASSKVVLAQVHFDQVVGNETHPWMQLGDVPLAVETRWRFTSIYAAFS
ncbi:MAG TPA: SIR2 family protein [Polyangiaceae bacterium]|nr:SIR2 family protein [Polyangiaceae bacterium]